MGYCTHQDLIDTFGEDEIYRLTSSDTEVEKAIVDAQAEIDMYLSVRYVLPIEHIPLSLNRIACDVARYSLYNTLDKDSTVYIRYQQRVMQLKEIAAGKISLGLAENGEAAGEQQVAFIETGSKVFGR